MINLLIAAAAWTTIYAVFALLSHFLANHPKWIDRIMLTKIFGKTKDLNNY